MTVLLLVLYGCEKACHWTHYIVHLHKVKITGSNWTGRYFSCLY